MIYLSSACLDTSKLADQGCGSSLKLSGTSIELCKAGFDVWGWSTDGGNGEESHGGKGCSVDGGELHCGGDWV